MIRALALALTAFAALHPAAAQEARLVRMGTASLAGTYFPVGVALCRLVNEARREHGIRCAAEPSAGSVANIVALRAGGIDLAIVQSDVQANALEGAGAFAEAGAFTGLRAVLSLYAEPLTIVARADAGIAGIADLPGKRISYGPTGSGQREIWDVLAAAMGWTPASFAAALELAPVDQAAALCENRIDAFAIAIGHPAPTVSEATNGCEARVVPVAGPEVAAIVASAPFYAEAEVPGGIYRGNPAPVPTFGVMATLVTRAEVADVVIATLVGDVLRRLQMLRTLDPVLAGLEPEAMATTGLTAPLHPAAEAVFRERGLLP